MGSVKNHNKFHDIKSLLAQNPNLPFSSKTCTNNMVTDENWTHKYHSSSLKKEPKPACEFCNISFISIKDQLLECLNLAEEKKLFPQPTNLEGILSINNINLLMFFLKRTN